VWLFITCGSGRCMRVPLSLSGSFAAQFVSHFNKFRYICVKPDSSFDPAKWSCEPLTTESIWLCTINYFCHIICRCVIQQWSLHWYFITTAFYHIYLYTLVQGGHNLTAKQKGFYFGTFPLTYLQIAVWRVLLVWLLKSRKLIDL